MHNVLTLTGIGLAWLWAIGMIVSVTTGTNLFLAVLRVPVLAWEWVRLRVHLWRLDRRLDRELREYDAQLRRLGYRQEES